MMTMMHPHPLILPQMMHLHPLILPQMMHLHPLILLMKIMMAIVVTIHTILKRREDFLAA
jgi:hypothetical protein